MSVVEVAGGDTEPIGQRIVHERRREQFACFDAGLADAYLTRARAFAAKHGYALDPRQELLGIGAANFAAAMGQGYPVAGGLSQSAVNDKAGARTSLALVFASMTLALCLLFLTGLLENLPKAVLSAVVYSGVMSVILLKLVGLVFPLRADASEETVGLDVSMHGEEAYGQSGGSEAAA